MTRFWYSVAEKSCFV